jgi:N-methylhydantoinase B
MTGIADAPAETVLWDGTRNSYRPAPDWRDRVSDALEIYPDAQTELDPVTYKVIRNRLWTINTAHGETVTRVSGSPVFASLDFNMCILTDDADIVMNAPFIQYLNIGAPYTVRFIMEHFSEEPGIHEGDVYLGNDPWVGAVHQMDVLFACPVFVDGKLFAWVSNAGHQYDLGGVVPGGWPQNALDVYHDPVLLSPFKIMERGKLRKDLERMYLRQSRMPELVALDLRAQLAGCRFAAEQIVQMCDHFGADTVKAAMRRIVESAQSAFAAKLRKLPDGTWSGVRYLEDRLPGDRKLYRVAVNLHKQGDRLAVDNQGSDRQQEGPLGITFQALAGSLLSALAITMMPEQLFALGGAERQISYDAEPGLLNTVQYPAAVSAAIVNVVTHLNMAQACIGRMLSADEELRKDIAAPCADYPVPVVSGTDDRGNFFGSAILDHFAMGGGARSFQDGVDSGGPAWSPLTFLLNVEAVEQWFPLVYLWRRELEDSGGAGRWRGGVGLAYAWTPYRAERLDVYSFAGGMSLAGFSGEGLLGGYPSPPSRTTLKRGTDLVAALGARRLPARIEDVAAQEVLMINGKANAVAMDLGDVAEAIIGGGGGYGDPLEREPERVAADVRDLRVSRDVARTVYGVALGTDGDLDAGATARLRDEIRDVRRAWSPPREASAAALPVEPRPATGAPPRRVHEAIVARDDGDARVLACHRCGTVLCGYGENVKEHLAVGADPLTASLPRANDPGTYVDGEEIVFRRYCCPGCQVLMTTEVVRAAEPPLVEMRLD